MERMTPRAIRIPDELWEGVQEQAKREYKSTSATIRIAIAQYLARERVTPDQEVNPVIITHQEIRAHCDATHEDGNWGIPGMCAMCDKWFAQAKRYQ
jgi:metal-responsive CopG/Arc/MetJ family transcriptional regulator